MKGDPVNHPTHYTSHPSGVECIQITEHMDFCLGNAVKYLWRAGLKGQGTEQPLEDLRKAVWYVQREIARREQQAETAKRAEHGIVGTRRDAGLLGSTRRTPLGARGHSA